MLKDKKNRFGILAPIRGLPDKADELRKRLLALVRLTQYEDGCLSCEMIENECDSTEFSLLEKWSNKKAHESHLRVDRIQNAMKAVHDLLSRELDIRKHLFMANLVRYGTNSYCTQ
mgnify:FL=1